MKKVTILIRHSPFNSLLVSEALRMSLGLTTANNTVTVVFMEDGVYLPAVVNVETMGYPDAKRHLETLQLVGGKLVADREALEMRKLLGPDLDVIVADREEIDAILTQSDQVIGF